jgi:hypothetical protein
MSIYLRLQQIKKQITAEAMAKEGFNYFRKITPIAAVNGGNARRNTFLNKDTIEANYPYARRLDEGYSPQARDGMTKPTEAYVQDWVKKQSKG